MKIARKLEGKQRRNGLRGRKRRKDCLRSSGSNPTPCNAIRNAHNVSRRVFCRFYDACLDYAIARNWSGFSCDECKCDSALEWETAQWDEDHFRCMTLVHFVMFSKLTLRVHGFDHSFSNRRGAVQPAGHVHPGASRLLEAMESSS